MVAPAETASPQPTKSAGGLLKSLVVFFFGAFMGLVAGGLVGFVAASAVSAPVIDKLEKELALAKSLVLTDEVVASVTPTPTPAVATGCADTEVFYTPGGLFDATLKAELESKISDPLDAYQRENGLCPLVVNFQTNPFETDYDYLVDVFYRGGVYEGRVVDGVSGSIEYWIPECLDTICTFSSAFEAAFPETVNAYRTANGL
ncbi:MAG: hypothetical protein QY330_03305 [Candidatus Dojkabacteria bacterium]|nr:MAG: hypothetical protein QY330_03305 [Candidatus Dojkabacteria bacterium]